MTNHHPNEQDVQARVAERRTNEKMTTEVTNLQKLAGRYRTQREVGEALGVSGSTVSYWLKDGSMPVTADLACRHLLGSQVCVIRVRCRDEEQAMRVVGVLDLLGVEYNQEPR